MDFMEETTPVWLADEQSAWLEAEVRKKNNMLTVRSNTGRKTVTNVSELLPRDIDCRYNLYALNYVNEAEILRNIKTRFVQDEIYTYAGSILIAVNPFSTLPQLYSEDVMQAYMDASSGGSSEQSPHVFAVVNDSYTTMMRNRQSQAMLISGESGSGKSETVNQVLQFLKYVSGSADDNVIVMQILAANTILEAFGNARTARNDNSSRFGKFVEIQFDESGKIAGAAYRTHLLQRSRVVQFADDERNYHCFYQLCASGKYAEKLKLANPKNFKYLNQSRTYELDGRSNAEEYLKTRRAMDAVGMNHAEQDAIFETLAAILHLGNAEFIPGQKHDSSILKDSKSVKHLEHAAKLLKCTEDRLLRSIYNCEILTTEGNKTISLDSNASTARRDALAKTVYAVLFDWLVNKLNRAIGQDSCELQIGILDIYGFDQYSKSSSLEEFCINFANEKIRHHSFQHVFNVDMPLLNNRNYVDNKDLLDLIEKNNFGFIALLDKCSMEDRTDFPSLILKTNSGNKRLERSKAEGEIIVSHSSGKVVYKVNNLFSENLERDFIEHTELLASSTSPIFVAKIPVQPTGSMLSRWKHEVYILFDIIGSRGCTYIQCLRPNQLKKSKLFDNLMVLNQLRSMGILEVARMYNERKCLDRKRDAMEQAARIIQSYCRGSLARKEYRVKREIYWTSMEGYARQWIHRRSLRISTQKIAVNLVDVLQEFQGGS